MVNQKMCRQGSKEQKWRCLKPRYLACITKTEEKQDLHSNWIKMNCGSELKVPTQYISGIMLLLIIILYIPADGVHFTEQKTLKKWLNYFKMGELSKFFLNGNMVVSCDTRCLSQDSQNRHITISFCKNKLRLKCSSPPCWLRDWISYSGIDLIWSCMSLVRCILCSLL